MFEPVQKPFTGVLAEHVSFDPNQGLLGNVGQNVGRAWTRSTSGPCGAIGPSR